MIPMNNTRPKFTKKEARKAIQQRIDGVWDAKELTRFGPLSTDQAEDVREIARLGDIKSPI